MQMDCILLYGKRKKLFNDCIFCLKPGIDCQAFVWPPPENPIKLHFYSDSYEHMLLFNEKRATRLI